MRLWSLSLCEQLRLLQGGEITAVEVVQSHLDRVEEVNGSLNAVVTVIDREEALAEARKIDASPRDARGPLAGCAMTIKDSLNTKGVRTTAGSLGLKDWVPDWDATVVRRLKEAGAILIGKTNTPELTLAFETDNKVFGRTNNPYDLARTPGGSSGGAAAVVAVGGAAFDIGTDYGGSIRVPSSWCGVAGLKPTHGRVSRHGHVLDFRAGLTESFQTVGPLARTVDDLRLLLPLIAGPDGVDPYVHPVPLPPPEKTSSETTSHLRVGLVVEDDVLGVKGKKNVTTFSDDCVRVLQSAADAIRLKVETVDIVEPSFFAHLGRTQDIWRGLALADDGAFYQKKLRDIGTTDPHLEWIFPDAAARKETSAAEVNDLLVELADYRRKMIQVFEHYDVLLCPVFTDGAAVLHGFPGADLDKLTFTYCFNLSGHPAVVVRGGSSSCGKNLPIGVQVVAPHWREDIALNVAKLIELHCPDAGWRLPSATTPAPSPTSSNTTPA